MQNNNNPSIVRIQTWEYEYAYHVGIRRFTENWGRNDASYYDRDKMEEDQKAQAAAALTVEDMRADAGGPHQRSAPSRVHAGGVEIQRSARRVGWRIEQQFAGDA